MYWHGPCVVRTGSAAEAAEAAGVRYLRAPVSGNPSVVEAGNLSIIVSGDTEALAQVEPALRDIYGIQT